MVARACIAVAACRYRIRDLRSFWFFGLRPAVPPDPKDLLICNDDTSEHAEANNGTSAREYQQRSENQHHFDTDMNTAHVDRIASFAGLRLDERRTLLASTPRIAPSGFWRHAKISGPAKQHITASGSQAMQAE